MHTVSLGVWGGWQSHQCCFVGDSWDVVSGRTGQCIDGLFTCFFVDFAELWRERFTLSRRPGVEFNIWAAFTYLFKVMRKHIFDILPPLWVLSPRWERPV